MRRFVSIIKKSCIEHVVPINISEHVQKFDQNIQEINSDGTSDRTSEGLTDKVDVQNKTYIVFKTPYYEGNPMQQN